MEKNRAKTDTEHEDRISIEVIDANDMPALQEAAEITWTVWEEMEHKDWYAPDAVNLIVSRLHGGEGMAYRAVDEESGMTAGVLILLFPGISEENLGRDAGFSGEQLERTAHVDSAAVLPAFRGRGLQQKLARAAEAGLRRLGYLYLMCTVHPDNRFSHDNMLRQGYRVIGRAVKYGGYQREILLKDFSADAPHSRPLPDGHPSGLRSGPGAGNRWESGETSA